MEDGLGDTPGGVQLEFDAESLHPSRWNSVPRKGTSSNSGWSGMARLRPLPSLRSILTSGPGKDVGPDELLQEALFQHPLVGGPGEDDVLDRRFELDGQAGDVALGVRGEGRPWTCSSLPRSMALSSKTS